MSTILNAVYMENVKTRPDGSASFQEKSSESRENRLYLAGTGSDLNCLRGRLWDPLNHEPESVSEDAKEGLGSPTSALTKYGATFDDDGTKDFKETEVMRKSKKQPKKVK